MVSIDLVYKTVLTFTNSDIRGNVKPTDARLAINDVVNEIYEEYLYEVNRIINRENRGLISGGLENISDRIREKIQHFLMEDVEMTYIEPYFTLPKDLRYIDGVFYNGVNDVEFCKDNKEFKIVANLADTAPTTSYPIGLKIGDKIKIAPTTIVDNVTISYLRNPKIANWTYQVVMGSEIFNPSAADFQDIDLHPSEQNNVVLRTLSRFGINLKEQDLQAAAQNQTAQDFNQENAS